MEAENKDRISITIDPDLLEVIEEKRGHEKRASFLNRHLRDHFGLSKA